jgi:ABC-type lipoprotein export system ATPase subunit
MVTHNIEVASAGDRIVHMRDGRVESDGRERSDDTAPATV